jgi:hypothetical protein
MSWITTGKLNEIDGRKLNISSHVDFYRAKRLNFITPWRVEQYLGAIAIFFQLFNSQPLRPDVLAVLKTGFAIPLPFNKNIF